MHTAAGRRRHPGVALAVLVAHVLIAWSLLASMRSPAWRVQAEPVMAWLRMPDARAPSVVPLPAPRALARPARVLPRAVVPLATVPAAQPPDPAATITLAPGEDVPRTPIDWQAAASDGARTMLRDGRAAARRDRSMGQAPVPPPVVKPPHESFAWGHQPKGKHYDAQGPIVTVFNKRCGVALLLVIPVGVGCNVGAINKEPGRGDLFDDMHRAQSLELPRERNNDPDAVPP